MANVDSGQQTARDLAQQARNVAQDTYRQYEPEIERYHTQFNEMVREKPIQSLAIAGAIAFALGAIWRK